jgi:hypothetical protein
MEHEHDAEVLQNKVGRFCRQMESRLRQMPGEDCPAEQIRLICRLTLGLLRDLND